MKTFRQLQSWKQTAKKNVAKLSPEEAKAIIADKTKAGPGIGHPKMRELTGGLSSQSIDMFVLRHLGIKAGYIKNKT